MVMADYFVVRLFPKMKVRCNGVFEEVDQEITDENHQKRAVARKPHRLGDHIQERHSEHVASAQSHKILQVATLPVAINDEVAAQQVAASGDKPQNSCQSYAS